MRTYEPYYSIIAKHLHGRTRETILQKDAETGQPVYTAVMLQECLNEVRKTNPAATLKDLVSLDIYSSGHIDYHRKMAFRLYELAEGRTK